MDVETVPILDSKGDWQPIPLTPFEAMMVLDDRPDFSMSCAAELRFDGEIERDTFEEAYRQAISRHKLLCAVVANDGKRQTWVPAAVRPAVFWNHENAHDEFSRMRRFDLTREPGVRTWVNIEGNQSILRFDFHHACCDAAGGMGSIEDLFTIYDGLKNRRKPNLRPLDDSRLFARNNIDIGPLSRSSRMKRGLLDIVKSLRLLFTRPLPIPPTGESGPPWKDRFIKRRFREGDLIRLRRAATDHSATLNDLMLVEFMCALRDWTLRDRVTSSSRGHIRLIAPMNLRDRADLALSAANKTGFGFVSRSLADLRGANTDRWHQTITSVHAEMETARKSRLPAQFLKKLAIAHRSQRLFASFFSEKRCWATAVLTQLGDPTRRFHHRFPRRNGKIVIGDLILTEIVSCAPLRPLTRALLSVNTYGNEMTLTMRCDPTTIAQSVAERFLDDFLQSLLSRRAEQPDVCQNDNGNFSSPAEH